MTPAGLQTALVFRLAWRSFLRHRRRSAITTLAVACSLALVLIFIGVADDQHVRLAQRGMRLGAGQVLIQGEGYQQAQTLGIVVQRPSTVLAAARSLPQVTAAAPRLRASGLLSTGESSAPVMVSGVDPDAEPRLSDIPARRTAGTYLRRRAPAASPGQPADIYVGAELARSLGLSVGDRTVLAIAPPGWARPASASFVVCGVFRTGVREIDAGYVEIPLPDAQNLAGLGPVVTQVALMLDRLEDTAPVVSELRTRLRGVEVLSWETVLEELHDVVVVNGFGISLLMGIIFTIAALGVFNTMLMSVAERTRELGVMMAVGTGRLQVFLAVLAEALVLAIVAAILGMALAGGLHLWVQATGINLDRWWGGAEFAGVVLDGYIYSRLTIAAAVRPTLLLMLLTLLASVYPALRAVHLRPVDAIRHV